MSAVIKILDMNIQTPFPSRILWKLSLAGISSFFDIFEGHTLKELKRAIKLFETSSLYFKFEVPDAPYLDKFVPLYENEIRKKAHANIIDVRDRIIFNPLHDLPYVAMSLYDGDNYLGGRIFSLSEDGIMGAFKILPHHVNIPLKKIPFSFVSEYYLVQYALQLNKKFITSGTTLNPFGVHSAIGLATYKFKAGAKPYRATKRCEIKEQFSWDGKEDVLLFLGDQLHEPLQKAVLFLTSSENIKERYGNLLAHATCAIEIVSQ